MFELDWREADRTLRERLAEYVDNHRQAYKAVSRLNPDADYARDAKRRLDQALQIQVEVESRIEARAAENK